jgi:hypothetical protein
MLLSVLHTFNLALWPNFLTEARTLLQAFIAPNPVSLKPELGVVTISIFMMALVDQRRSTLIWH